VRRALLLAVAALSLVAGCGGEDNEAVVTTDVRVYFLRDGKVWPVLRQIPSSGSAVTAALGELSVGPTEEERARLDADSAVPNSLRVTVANGVAAIEHARDLAEEARAQVVYTLTYLPGIDSVAIDGKTYTRADFEDQTPGILVESPLPFEQVSFPVRATGTANTFEATFNYELAAPNGKVVFEDFVTATSGTGTRGTFEFTTDALDHPAEGAWALRVFERSAEDGSRTKVVEIPLRMSQ
jgi:germination protein M